MRLLSDGVQFSLPTAFIHSFLKFSSFGNLTQMIRIHDFIKSASKKCYKKKPLTYEKTPVFPLSLQILFVSQLLYYCNWYIQLHCNWPFCTTCISRQYRRNKTHQIMLSVYTIPLLRSHPTKSLDHTNVRC